MAKTDNRGSPGKKRMLIDAIKRQDMLRRLRICSIASTWANVDVCMPLPCSKEGRVNPEGKILLSWSALAGIFPIEPQRSLADPRIERIGWIKLAIEIL